MSYEQAERALGVTAMSSLGSRALLVDVQVPGLVAPWGHDRVQGALIGLAFGDALAEWAQRARAAGRTLGEREVREFIELHDGLPIDRRQQLGFTDPVSGVSQMMVLAADAWLGSGWQAPSMLSDELVRRVRTMRVPGDATRRAVERRAAGRPWYEAAGGSFGDAQLPRAVAVGLVHAGQHDAIGLAASLDACVTHASPRAVATSVTLAGIVASIVCDIPMLTFSWDRLTRRIVEAAPDATVRSLCLAALAGQAPADDVVPPLAAEVLATALRFAASSIEPTQALVDAIVHGGGERTVPAITGALVGAAYGARALPPRAGYVEGFAGYQALAARIPVTRRGAPVAGAASPGGDAASAGDGSGHPHIWFLLDRSGSMASIQTDVVEGFEHFFATQREQSGAADVTIVQFDGHEPDDVIVDARPLAEVPSIRDRFFPRGMTPLYDAIGGLLDRAEAAGGAAADQLIVILTDGGENASRKWGQRELFARIGSLRQQGWTFVFLGANQDSYQVGAGLDIGAGNVSNFTPSPSGLQATYDGLSRSVGTWRSRSRAERQRQRDDFWGGVKEAEDVGR